MNFQQYYNQNINESDELNKCSYDEILNNVGEYNRYIFRIQPRVEGFVKVNMFDPYDDDSEIKSWWTPATDNETREICMKYINKIPFIRAQEAAIETFNHIINALNTAPGSYYYHKAGSLGYMEAEIMIMFVVDKTYTNQKKVNKALGSVKNNTEINKLFKKNI